LFRNLFIFLRNNMNDYCAEEFDDAQLHHFLPSESLKPFIEGYIYFSFPANKLCNQYLYPLTNGNLEIYLCLGESCISIKRQHQEIYFKHFLFGIFDFFDQPLIKPLTKDAHYSSILIQLKFSASKYLFDIPLSKLQKQFIELENLWGSKGKDLKKILQYKIEIQETIQYLNCFFEVFFQSTKVNENYKRLDYILDFCKQKKGVLTVDELANHTKLSYRTIHRLFTDEIGVCPKNYLKIIRFNKVCNFINCSNKVNWSELIYACGYYDQAHFIHDFKSIMKFTPNDFLKHTSGKFYLLHPYFFES